MTARELEALTPQLLALPVEDRLKLGELLIESVDTFSDDELRTGWRDELARRIDDLKSGRVQGIPAALNSQSLTLSVEERRRLEESCEQSRRGETEVLNVEEVKARVRARLLQDGVTGA